MKVKVLKDDKHCGIKAGEVYKAKAYIGNRDKVILLSRIPDGYDPGVTQYRKNLEFVK